MICQVMRLIITLRFKPKRRRSAMKKLATLLSLITVPGLLLSACGGAAATSAPAQTDAPEATEPAATEAPATEPAATEPAGEAEATLKIWADDTRTPILLELADDFRAE